MIRALNHKFRRRSIHAKSSSSIFMRALKYTSKNFCRRSNLHGFKYTQARKETSPSDDNFINHCIWYFLCLVGFVLAIYLIQLVLIKYTTTPTITTVETTNYPIWNVKFPAVTFCNINKVYAPATDTIREKLTEKGLSADSVQRFLSQLSALIKARPIDPVILETYRYLEILNYTTKQLMLELIQPCENMILTCNWLGKSYPCQSMFRVTASTEGFCCSFNQKALKTYLEIHNNRDSVSNQLNQPVYRAAGYGEYVGLSVLLNSETDAYVSPCNDFHGISVIIHEAEDFPESSYSSVVVQPGEEVAVAVVPNVVVSKPEVRSLPLTQRNCLFPDEQRLRTTDKYTYQSCLTECVVDTILEICGCIPFYYPHLHLAPYAQNSRQCSLHDVNCLLKHNNIFSSFEPPWHIQSVNDSAVRGMNCDCLPSCSEQFFRIQPTGYIRQLNTSVYLTIPEHEIPQRLRVNSTAFWRFSKVQVFFKDISCIKYRREIYMTWDALIASFGGIFGLCFGGSVISLFEMIYYFTFRLWHRMFVLAMRKRRNRQRISQPTDALDDVGLDETIGGMDRPKKNIDLTQFGYYA